jgi:hypothetical protein
MSYQKRPSKPWLVIRKQGTSPVRVVSGQRFKTKKKAQREADDLSKLFEGRPEVKFDV